MEPNDPESNLDRLLAEYLRRVELEGACKVADLCGGDLVLELALAQRVDELEGLRQRLQRPEAAPVDEPGSLHLPPVPSTHEDLWAAMRARLSADSSKERYQIHEPLGSGGMGIVHRVWDRKLHRSLAMKTLRPEVQDWSPKVLARFLDEAQITAQLNHPGIVPVHDVGLDAQDRLYYTMQLVRGEDLKRIFHKVRLGDERWTLGRAVSVLLRVCEAMSFAHARGVVHRDLKPGNVMVGRFGETYVMDWGLTRVLSASAPGGSDASALVETDRTEWSGHEGSPPLTLQRAVVGTPGYMSPEQVDSSLGEISPLSDVYAVGAMLYELQAGFAPYYDLQGLRSRFEVLQKIVREPPTPLDSLPRAIPELIAITQRAMAIRPEDRYGSMDELAEELRAFLDHRVVRAYRTGAVVEFGKWVRRNRLVATLAGSLLTILLLASFLVLRILQGRARDSESARTAIQREKDALEVPALIERARDLGPIGPSGVDDRRDWLAEVDDISERAAVHRARLDALRAQGRLDPGRADLLDPDERVLAHNMRHLLGQGRLVVARDTKILEDPQADEDARELAQRNLDAIGPVQEYRQQWIDRLERRLELGRGWRLPDAGLQDEHDRLTILCLGLDRLLHPGDGLRGSVAEELTRAEGLVADTVEAYADRWRDAIESIADPHQCPRYEGHLRLTPQAGLVPLDQDPESGLWEFWHPLSGGEPEQDESGRYAMTRETGMVFVLIPAGEFLFGAQSKESEAPGHDPLARDNEGPVERIALDAFFLSKYEVTQGQWLRATGFDPSLRYAGSDWRGYGVVPATHPVEFVTWNECSRVARRWGLMIPTEAQWEFAARAGGDTPYWSGQEPDSLLGKENMADLSLARLQFPGVTDRAVEDRYPVEAPVGSMAPNGFGLYDISGNVFEWCLDWYVDKFDTVARRPGTGENLGPEWRRHPVRGGGFKDLPENLRVSRREAWYPDASADDFGFRPARPLTTGSDP